MVDACEGDVGATAAGDGGKCADREVGSPGTQRTARPLEAENISTPRASRRLRRPQASALVVPSCSPWRFGEAEQGADGFGRFIRWTARQVEGTAWVHKSSVAKPSRWECPHGIGIEQEGSEGGAHPTEGSAAYVFHASTEGCGRPVAGTRQARLRQWRRQCRPLRPHREGRGFVSTASALGRLCMTGPRAAATASPSNRKRRREGRAASSRGPCSDGTEVAPGLGGRARA